MVLMIPESGRKTRMAAWTIKSQSELEKIISAKDCLFKR